MKIIFSPHAIERLQEREVGMNIAMEALHNPDKYEISRQDPKRFLSKKVYYSKKSKRVHLLMLVCERSKNALEVVTVIDTSKISKYL